MLPAYAGMILTTETVYTENIGAPRIRGDDPASITIDDLNAGVLPAYAGMIPSWLVPVGLKCGAPRIRGDDPGPPFLPWSGLLCSPHTRG